MNPEYLEVDPETWLVKDYPDDIEPDVNDLTEVYVVVYTLEPKKGFKEPTEVYTFTTDFEQAYKRFKLLPHTQGLLKRILTDDDNLIQMAREGTKPKAQNTPEEKNIVWTHADITDAIDTIVNKIRRNSVDSSDSETSSKCLSIAKDYVEHDNSDGVCSDEECEKCSDDYMPVVVPQLRL